MSKEIADLIRERDSFQLQGNDHMVNEIQKIIDAKLNSHNLNEVVKENSSNNTFNIND